MAGVEEKADLVFMAFQVNLILEFGHVRDVQGLNVKL